MTDEEFKRTVLEKLDMLIGSLQGFRARVSTNEQRLDALEQWRLDSTLPTQAPPPNGE